MNAIHEDDEESHMQSFEFSHFQQRLAHALRVQNTSSDGSSLNNAR